MRTLDSNQAFHRLAALSGVVGPLLFVLITIAAGALHGSYNHLSQVVSELGAVDSPVRIWQTVNFFMIGTALILFTLSFHKRFEGSTTLTTGLMLYFAVSTGIGTGLFSCDPGCGMLTITGVLHIVSGLTSFMALSVVIFLIASKMRQLEAWSGWATYTRITGFLVTGFFVAWMIGGPGGNLLPHIQGILQRLMFISFLQWFVVMSLHLLKQPMRVTHD